MPGFSLWIDSVGKNEATIQKEVSDKLTSSEYTKKLSEQVNHMPLHMKFTIQKGIQMAKEKHKDNNEVITSLQELEVQLWLIIKDESWRYVDNKDMATISWHKVDMYPRDHWLDKNSVYPVFAFWGKSYDISWTSNFGPGESFKIKDEQRTTLVEVWYIGNKIVIDIKSPSITQEEETIEEEVTVVKKVHAKAPEEVTIKKDAANNDVKEPIPVKEKMPAAKKPRTKNKDTGNNDIKGNVDVVHTSIELVEQIQKLPTNTFLAANVESANKWETRCSENCRINLENYTDALVWNWINDIRIWNAVDLLNNEQHIDKKFEWNINDLNLEEVTSYLYQRILDNKWSIFDCYMKLDGYDSQPLMKSHRFLVSCTSRWELVVIDSSITRSISPIPFNTYFNKYFINYYKKDGTVSLDRDLYIGKWIYYPKWYTPQQQTVDVD